MRSGNDTRGRDTLVVIAVVIAFPIGRATTFVYGFGARVAL